MPGTGEEGMFLGHIMTPPLMEAAIMVLTDMGLALISVVANLMVINSLREKEHLLGVTQNMVRVLTFPPPAQVLLNICGSNLVSAVFVKSISIVHNGYAVASRDTKSNIAFCTIFTLGHRCAGSLNNQASLTFNFTSFCSC